MPPDQVHVTTIKARRAGDHTPPKRCDAPSCEQLATAQVLVKRTIQHLCPEHLEAMYDFYAGERPGAEIFVDTEADACAP